MPSASKTSIGLDVRMLESSGIGTTIRGLLDHLTGDQRSRLTLIGPREFRGRYPESGYIETGFPVYSLTQHWAFGRRLMKENLSLYHMPHYDVPLSYSGPLIVTVHDLIHYLYPQYSTKPFTKLYSAFLLRHAAAKADRIIAVSENTKKDLIVNFPQSAEKIVVIENAVDRVFSPLIAEQVDPVMRRHKLNAGYFLYVGNIRASKNTLALLDGYAALKKSRPSVPELVIAGKNSYADLDVEKRGGPGTRYLGLIDGADLTALYNGASIFVFPSLYEGFGLPPLEAMACGIPVLASRAASLPEVCGDAAEYLDENNAQGIAAKLAFLSGSTKRRHQLREKGLERAKKFSWDRFAQRTWAVYEDVLKKRTA